MVFTANRQTGGKEKRSPLAGWLGKKPKQNSDEILPDIDVSAGLSRALKVMAPKTHSDDADDVDPIRNALAAIEAALYAIDRIRDILEQASEVATSAQEVEDAGGRALLAETYDELRAAVTESIERIDERAGLLIGKHRKPMDVPLGGKAHYSVSPTRFDLSEQGLNLTPPCNAFEAPEEIGSILTDIDNALSKADRTAAGYCRDAQFLMARLKTAQAA